jgi:uncharacterized SAM-binding protein YcdF (DUF218 family)
MYPVAKAFVVNLLFPIPLCLSLLVAGVILLCLTKKEHMGKIFVMAGTGVLLLASLPFVPNKLLGNIERHYPAITIKNPHEHFEGIEYVVVLAGDHVLDSKVPITGQFSYSGIVRLIEGIRLHRKMGETKLILSGGPGADSLTDAELMARLAVELGISENDIILESSSMSTLDEALFISRIVGKRRFLLVTSASHMVRAMGLFNKLGMNPVPAPTDHLVKSSGDGISIFPRTSNIVKSDTLIYEYLGLIKERLRGNIETGTRPSQVAFHEQ